jgi:hypothetical protein
MDIQAGHESEWRTNQRKLGWSRVVGIDPAVMVKTPSERPFYRPLSMIVFFVSTVSAVAVTITVSYWLGLPVLAVSWVGLLWLALMLFGIEPLMLHVASARSGWWLIPAIVPRLLLTVLLAIAVTEPLLLSLNGDAISEYLDQQQTERSRAASTAAGDFYNPRIAENRTLINAMRGQETSLREKIERLQFQAGKASSAVYREHDLRLAALEQERLDAAIERHAPRLRTARREIRELRTARDTEARRRQRSIMGNDGLKAREQALAELKKLDDSLDRQVWFLRVFFFVIDLLPLTIKLTRVLTVPSPAEAFLEAEREVELTRALRVKDDAMTEGQRIKQRGRARRDLYDVMAQERVAAQGAIVSERWRAWAMTEVNQIWSRFRGERVAREDADRNERRAV